MTEEQEVEILKETSTTLMDNADTTAEKKRPGPINSIQAAAFITATTTSIDKFITTIHNYETYALQSCYETLIDEYYQELIQIEEYFKDADKDLVLDLVDLKTCKIIRVETQKDSEDRKRCPDLRISTPNLMTGAAALTRLAALPNFEKIDGDDRVKYHPAMNMREERKQQRRKLKHQTPKRKQHHPVRYTQRCPHWKMKMHQQDRRNLNLRSQYLLRNIIIRSDRFLFLNQPVFLPDSNYCIFS